MRVIEVGFSALLYITLLDNNILNEGQYLTKYNFERSAQRLINLCNEANNLLYPSMKYEIDYSIYYDKKMTKPLIERFYKKYAWLKTEKRKLYLNKPNEQGNYTEIAEVLVLRKNTSELNLPDSFPFVFTSRKDIMRNLKNLVGSNLFLSLYPEQKKDNRIQSM